MVLHTMFGLIPKQGGFATVPRHGSKEIKKETAKSIFEALSND